MLQSQGQTRAEGFIDKSLFMLVISEDDISPLFSAHRSVALQRSIKSLQILQFELRHD